MSKMGPGGTAPKGGKQPQQKKAVKPAQKIGKVVKGAPTRGNGSDTSPWSSARKGT
jgi:hypothetical protein